ncbi:phage antirepressor KilAC domain-containing protein [Cohaesibacter celericrescens]|uniref:Antirepressor protein C-terminal domain-containing protein n=1 Tax=Cohaesibacter celericrescens TaxID=2067669 RepID=A0A2N5XQV2_9HYPH|nr:phage antirepressor KilAC domain-containing protein [Cohaesibacter celericrescens]PLW76820.1 hypothetical protein C0081_12225 [Cohaesibacter celericrescens]
MTDLVNFSNEMTMTSVEIAELCGKKHPHVLRDIRKMLIDIFGGKDLEKIVPEQYRNRHSEYIRENADSIMGAIFGDDPNRVYPTRGFKWARDKRGYVTEFQLNKDLTVTLVTGYRADLRYKVIKRWQQLEEQNTSPVVALNDPAQLRALLLDNVEKVLALQAENGELKPLAASYERLTRAGGTLCISDAAKALNKRPKDLFSELQAMRWIYRRAGNGHWIGYAAKVQQGLLDHRVNEVTTADGNCRITEQVRITSKGMARLGERFTTLFAAE